VLQADKLFVFGTYNFVGVVQGCTGKEFTELGCLDNVIIFLQFFHKEWMLTGRNLDLEDAVRYLDEKHTNRAKTKDFPLLQYRFDQSCQKKDFLVLHWLGSGQMTNSLAKKTIIDVCHMTSSSAKTIDFLVLQ
jgi:hypothetical protein